MKLILSVDLDKNFSIFQHHHFCDILQWIFNKVIINFQQKLKVSDTFQLSKLLLQFQVENFK